MITYANNPPQFSSRLKFLQNRICTVADSFRVADDFGKLRCQLTYFNRPIFGWKGSYVVCNVSLPSPLSPLTRQIIFQAGAEKKVSFDWGPEGSKAEDCFFGMVALDQGYTFNFIQGEMHEKSPFTFSDFMKQRKRWMQGIYLVCASNHIPVKSKFLLSLSLGEFSFPTKSAQSVEYLLSRCLADHPPLHLKRRILLPLPHESGPHTGLPPLFHWCDGSLHVYIWLHQAVQHTQIFLSSNILLICRNNSRVNSQVKIKTFPVGKFRLNVFFSVFFVRIWL